MLKNDNSLGYLYVATGEKYVGLALNSAISLKKQRTSYPICLITDDSSDYEGLDNHFDRIILLERDFTENEYKLNKLFKLKGIISSPYEHTFYIDSDTLFLENCDELFDLLAFANLIMVKDPVDESHPIIDGTYYPATPYNTGMMVYNNSKDVKHLLDLWYDIRKSDLIGDQEYWGDQPAFMEAALRAMKTSEPKILVTSLIYNFPFLLFNGIPKGNVKLIHGVHNDIQLIGKLINRQNNHRGWNPVRLKNYSWSDAQDTVVTRLLKVIYRLIVPNRVKEMYRKIK